MLLEAYSRKNVSLSGKTDRYRTGQRHVAWGLLWVILGGLSPGLDAAASGSSFLLAEPSARPESAGGAFAAVGGDLNSLIYNPAGLAFLTGSQAALSHLEGPGDWSHDWI